MGCDVTGCWCLSTSYTYRKESLESHSCVGSARSPLILYMECNKPAISPHCIHIKFQFLVPSGRSTVDKGPTEFGALLQCKAV